LWPLGFRQSFMYLASASGHSLASRYIYHKALSHRIRRK
jgi:hypothetical protein